jgi:hypothetical protein
MKFLTRNSAARSLFLLISLGHLLPMAARAGMFQSSRLDPFYS